MLLTQLLVYAFMQVNRTLCYVNILAGIHRQLQFFLVFDLRVQFVPKTDVATQSYLSSILACWLCRKRDTLWAASNTNDYVLLPSNRQSCTTYIKKILTKYGVSHNIKSFFRNTFQIKMFFYKKYACNLFIVSTRCIPVGSFVYLPPWIYVIFF